MELEPTIVKNDFSFVKNLTFIVLFLLITPLAIGASMFTLASLSNAEVDEVESVAIAEVDMIEKPVSGVSVFAALPDIQPSVSGFVNAEDARIELIRLFLETYKSPLEPYSKVLVETSDKYGLDYRLLPAIALKESGGCKVIPKNSYNCWGWGIHSKGSLGFKSYEEGIEVVSKGLKEKYIDRGYETIDDIMSKYAHESSTTWADDVVIYMDQMQ